MTLLNEANIHYWFPNSFHYFSEVAIVALSIDWLTLIFYAYERCTVGKKLYLPTLSLAREQVVNCVLFSWPCKISNNSLTLRSRVLNGTLRH
jgi:hypothetical protein